MATDDDITFEGIDLWVCETSDPIGPFLPPPPPDHPVSVHWYCGMFVGVGGWFEDPPECSGEVDTVEELEEWEAGGCQAQCPSCGAILYQGDGHAERTDEP